MAVSAGWAGNQHAAVMVTLLGDVVGGARAARYAGKGKFVGWCNIGIWGGSLCCGSGYEVRVTDVCQAWGCYSS